MGLTAKPFGKIESITRKMQNELLKEEQLRKKKKDKEGDDK